jgi:hypothetical protein
MQTIRYSLRADCFQTEPAFANDRYRTWGQIISWLPRGEKPTDLPVLVPDTTLTIEPTLDRLTSYNQLGQSRWKRTLKRKLPLALALSEVRNE